MKNLWKFIGFAVLVALAFAVESLNDICQNAAYKIIVRKFRMEFYIKSTETLTP